MSKLIAHKRLITRYYRALDLASPAELADVVCEFHAPGAPYRAVHPINDLAGPAEIAEQLLSPLRVAIPDLQHRPYIVMAGHSRDADWVCVTGVMEGVMEVVIGTQPSGQGHETSFAQVAADMMGVPVEQVKILVGDTDIVSVGGGSHSGRSMRHAGTVIALASEDLINKGRAIAALHFKQPEERVSFEDGQFIVKDSNFSIGVFELAKVAAQMDLPDGLKGGMAVARDNEMHDPVFPNGAAICEVEIDAETCEMQVTRYATIDDVGRCINPMIVHGQTHGGIVQGLGQAIFEQCYLEPGTGQPLCGSFMDYGMPRASDMPSFDAEIAEVLSPTNPLGIKAGGEGGTTPALATLVNAVVDALAPYGVEHIDMPVTPLAIWRAIHSKTGA